MVLNKKGSWMLFGLMMFVWTFIIATLFIAPLKEVITDARGSAGLNCSLATLSTGTAMTCVAVDLFLPYFIIAVIILGASFLSYKMV